MEEEVRDLRSLNEINEDLIKNYQTQVLILKSMVADRDRLITIYEKQLLIQDKYINNVNEEIGLKKNSLLR
jgi:hypothetical protein